MIHFKWVHILRGRGRRRMKYRNVEMGKTETGANGYPKGRK